MNINTHIVRLNFKSTNRYSNMPTYDLPNRYEINFIIVHKFIYFTQLKNMMYLLTVKNKTNSHIE